MYEAAAQTVGTFAAGAITGGATLAGDASLAVTGGEFNALPFIIGAVVLVILGGAAMLFMRRRRPGNDDGAASTAGAAGLNDVGPESEAGPSDPETK